MPGREVKRRAGKGGSVLAKAKDVIGRTIHATDGNIGSVTTLYFDDDRWTVRYLVVDTGKWLPGKQVLISPYSIRQGSAVGALKVSLTREQVKNSPRVDAERPISRQQEIAYSDYYGYPYYWAGPAVWGAAAVPMWQAVPNAAVDRTTAAEREALRAHDERNAHLRDVKHVTGYHIQAADGSIGHVDDFLLDTESWMIRYLVVDTSNWIGGRHVLIAPNWVRVIRWETSQVEVGMTREAIARSPEYDRDGDVQRSYEDRLHAHYVQPPYWAGDRAATADVDPDRHVARLDQFNELEIAEGDTDVRNWTVVTGDGVTVGRVEHLIVDRTAMRVRYLEVGLDEPDGGGERDVLIPIEYVELDKAGRQVRLHRISSSRIAAVPSFTGLPIDPELVAETRTHFGRPLSEDDPEPALQGEPGATAKADRRV
jgi:sporulation protein YlmC with PRC-barrel domain